MSNCDVLALLRGSSSSASLRGKHRRVPMQMTALSATPRTEILNINATVRPRQGRAAPFISITPAAAVQNNRRSRRVSGSSGVALILLETIKLKPGRLSELRLKRQASAHHGGAVKYCTEQQLPIERPTVKDKGKVARKAATLTLASCLVGCSRSERNYLAPVRRAFL